MMLELAVSRFIEKIGREPSHDHRGRPFGINPAR